MTEEITSTPTSYNTSELTPITIQESPNVQIQFCGIHVENQADLRKNIEGSLVIKKKTKSLNNFEDNKFTRKDIKRIILGLIDGKPGNCTEGSSCTYKA